jgi:hypothetical protein
MSSANTPVSYQEMKERLENSTNEQIGDLVFKMGELGGKGKGINPFKDPKNRYALPSAIRARWIDQLLAWYREGEIAANK